MIRSYTQRSHQTITEYMSSEAEVNRRKPEMLGHEVTTLQRECRLDITHCYSVETSLNCTQDEAHKGSPAPASLSESYQRDHHCACVPMYVIRTNTVVYLIEPIERRNRTKIQNQQRPTTAFFIILYLPRLMCYVFRCKDDGRMVECEP